VTQEEALNKSLVFDNAEMKRVLLCVTKLCVQYYVDSWKEQLIIQNKDGRVFNEEGVMKERFHTGGRPDPHRLKCLFIWSDKWSDREKARSHSRHWNGRSPEEAHPR